MALPPLKLHELERMAQRVGFEDYKTLLYELYVVRRMSLVELGERLHIHYKRVKRHLRRFGIPIRARGGANNVKAVMTKELLQEVIRDGAPTVARRLGIQVEVLYSKLKSLDRK